MTAMPPAPRGSARSPARRSASGGGRRPWRRAPGTPRRRGRGRRSRRRRERCGGGRSRARRRPRGRRPRGAGRIPRARSFSTISPGPGHPFVLGPLAGGGDAAEVHPVAADVQVFRVLVHAGHLDRRHQLDPNPLRRILSFNHPSDRVMVRQRQRRNTSLGSLLNHVRRRQLPVGNRRMTLQLDQHRRQTSCRVSSRNVVRNNYLSKNRTT